MDADFESELQWLLANDQKIEAIKRYREEYGVGLKEAKDAIEALEFGFDRTQPGGSVPEDVKAEIVSLLERGQKIAAIKVYREQFGTGLKEAKDAVEAIAGQHGIESVTGSGCLGLVLFVFVLVVGGTLFV